MEGVWTNKWFIETIGLSRNCLEHKIIRDRKCSLAGMKAL
jgi:hypothetical protein